MAFFEKGGLVLVYVFLFPAIPRLWREFRTEFPQSENSHEILILHLRNSWRKNSRDKVRALSSYISWERGQAKSHQMFCYWKSPTWLHEENPRRSSANPLPLTTRVKKLDHEGCLQLHALLGCPGCASWLQASALWCGCDLSNPCNNESPLQQPDGSGLSQQAAHVTTRAAIYRSLRTLRSQNRQKVSKKVFSGVCRKVSKNTPKSQKKPTMGPFWVFLDSFGYLLGLFCRPQKMLGP